MSIKKTLYGANFDLEFDLDPAVGQWSLVEGDEGSALALLMKVQATSSSLRKSESPIT